jgi:ABC-type phosphate transport system substrate-binding protein
MNPMRRKGRVALLGGASILAAAGLGIVAGPAGAIYPGGNGSPGSPGLVNPANSVIVGSGSSTTYYMMQSLDTLFNDSQGCQTFVSSGTQNLDFSCTPGQTFPPTNSSGQKLYGYTENPINDVAVEESPLGSSNGIKQLEDSGAHGASSTVPVANNVNYARSSRDLASTDDQGLNFVAYAKDGVTWFHFTEFDGKPTPSAKVTNLSLTQLEEIWGSRSATGAITKWKKVGGKSAPIDVFAPQEGSGTQSTFKTAIGFDPSSGSVAAIQDGALNNQNNIIFENEDAQILDLPKIKTGPMKGYSPADIGIFIFSTGKYKLSCESSPSDCGFTALPKGDANAIGQINGVTATQSTILSGTFPIVRYLYNVYSNGSNPNIPAATAATLNYVSEDGFICKPQTAPTGKITDPNTGAWYHAEIENIITANGYIALPNGAPDKGNKKPVPEGSVPHTAYALMKSEGSAASPYLKWDKPKLASNGQPTGFCYVTTTDGNSGS